MTRAEYIANARAKAKVRASDVKINARIPADLHKRLKIEATHREIPLNEMICLALSRAKPLASPKSISG